MRFVLRQKIKAVLAAGLILLLTGCASTPAVPAPPAKPAGPVYARVDIQKVLDAHPARARLRQMEQAYAEIAAKEADKTAEMEIARNEFAAAMKVRENEDRAALEKKQEALRKELEEQRRLFVNELEALYRPLLFNIDLKLQAIQLPAAEKQVLQKERERIETEYRQKLTAKETELGNRFTKEMDAYAADLSSRAETYAKEWMDRRMGRIEQAPPSAEQEKQRREIVELSERMIRDARAAAAKVAAQEKIDLVWLKSAVHKPVKDITELVTREIANAK